MPEDDIKQRSICGDEQKSYWSKQIVLKTINKL